MDGKSVVIKVPYDSTVFFFIMLALIIGFVLGIAVTLVATSILNINFDLFNIGRCTDVLASLETFIN